MEPELNASAMQVTPIIYNPQIKWYTANIPCESHRLSTCGMGVHGRDGTPGHQDDVATLPDLYPFRCWGHGPAQRLTKDTSRARL